MPDTQANLKEAFSGESQANRKYVAFARKAEQDGFPVVARLFRAAAELEPGPARQAFLDQACAGNGPTAATPGSPAPGA